MDLLQMPAKVPAYRQVRPCDHLSVASCSPLPACVGLSVICASAGTTAPGLHMQAEEPASHATQHSRLPQTSTGEGWLRHTGKRMVCALWPCAGNAGVLHRTRHPCRNQALVRLRSALQRSTLPPPKLWRCRDITAQLHNFCTLLQQLARGFCGTNFCRHGVCCVLAAGRIWTRGTV